MAFPWNKINFWIYCLLAEETFKWAKSDLFTRSDEEIENDRVALKYQVWSETAKEGTVFENQAQKRKYFSW